MSKKRILRMVEDPATRKVLAFALDNGWEFVGYTKAGHMDIVWPETDTHVFTGTTPSDRNAWRQFARELKRISGIEYPTGNHRRSRKSCAPSGFSIDAARRDQREAEAARKAERERRKEAERIIAHERDFARHREIARHEIEDLMRPGWS